MEKVHNGTMSKKKVKKESRRTALTQIGREMALPRRTASVRRALEEEEETRKKPTGISREEQRLEANCEPSNPRCSRENPAA